MKEFREQFLKVSIEKSLEELLQHLLEKSVEEFMKKYLEKSLDKSQEEFLEELQVDFLEESWMVSAIPVAIPRGTQQAFRRQSKRNL